MNLNSVQQQNQKPKAWE